MSRPCHSRPPTVLLVAEDRALLRHLSRFLGAVGYSVCQLADPQRVVALLETDPPPLVVVDAGECYGRALDVCRQVSQAEPIRHAHLLLLVGMHSDLDVLRALEAGVDDFLAKPLVYGELLARLRAGARAQEFEGRVRRLQMHDPVTGLPGPAALAERLRHCACDDAAMVACVVLGLDFFQQITEAYGRWAGKKVLQSVAHTLTESCDDTLFVAALDGDRFACLLPGRSDRDAADWAEDIRRSIAETTLPLGEAEVSLSASFGVAVGNPSAGPLGALIGQASEALRRAKESGRNCVARYGQFTEEERAWTELAAPGKLFERTVARDVMSPCPLTLHGDKPAAEAAALLRRTRLEGLAVVDHQGQYQGTATGEQLCDPFSAKKPDAATVGERTSGDVPVFDPDTHLGRLLEYFAQEGGTVAAIVQTGKPIGFVSAASLAELTRPPQPPSGGEPGFESEYLRVPECFTTAAPD